MFVQFELLTGVGMGRTFAAPSSERASYLILSGSPLRNRLAVLSREFRASLLFAVVAVHNVAAQSTQSKAPAPADIQAAAMEIMKAARYTTLITVGQDGQPQAQTRRWFFGCSGREGAGEKGVKCPSA